DDVEYSVERRFVRHLMPAFAGSGKRLPPKTWEQMIATVKQLRPHAAPALGHLEKLIQTPRRPLVAKGFQTVALEKDAVGLALDMFSLDRRPVLRSWAIEEDAEPAPFLRGLAPSYLIEDQVIAHDASFFGEWLPLRQHVTGAAEFGRDGQRLTIFNVNRTSLENALGVDLLYYHHHYQAYVLVQYKMMTRAKRRKSHSTAVFRPDDDTVEEVQRMIDFSAGHPDPGAGTEALLYRLHPEAFVLKLCHRVVLEADSTGLLKGMYLPLDYYRLLIESGSVTGPRGGIGFTHARVGRYLNNSLFVELVQRGWIGSRGDVSDAIGLAAQQARTGRDLIVAVTSSGSSRSEAGSDEWATYPDEDEEEGEAFDEIDDYEIDDDDYDDDE
ncbi:MAG TPA: hypothetical protein PLZ61_06840, partial [Candidatus Cryosericum sp.]|nr:hypothetical protein [Candidatus Cryosericum sp.]